MEIYYFYTKSLPESIQIKNKYLDEYAKKYKEIQCFCFETLFFAFKDKLKELSMGKQIPENILQKHIKQIMLDDFYPPNTKEIIIPALIIRNQVKGFHHIYYYNTGVYKIKDILEQINISSNNIKYEENIPSNNKSIKKYNQIRGVVHNESYLKAMGDLVSLNQSNNK